MHQDLSWGWGGVSNTQFSQQHLKPNIPRKKTNKTFFSWRRQATNPYPWDIVGASCLWAPPECHRQSDSARGIGRHGNELCAFPARGVKRGNFWNDGCRRWCPICFSSLQFTASAVLCKQLGSITPCSAISLLPPSSFSSIFFHAQSAMSLREDHFRFFWRSSAAFPFCLDARIGVLPFHPSLLPGATVVLTIYSQASRTSGWRLRNVVVPHNMATTGSVFPWQPGRYND